MKKYLFAVALFLCAGSCLAADSNDVTDLKADVTRLRKIHQRDLQENEKLKAENQQLIVRIKLLEKLCLKVGYTPAETNQKLAVQIKTAPKLIADNLSAPFEVGQIGRLGGNRLVAHTIHGDKDMTAKWNGSYENIIWLKGIPTTGLASNSPIKFDGILKITGTKKYDTESLAGITTAFVFEPLNIYE
jgi:hypothetical protein